MRLSSTTSTAGVLSSAASALGKPVGFTPLGGDSSKDHLNVWVSVFNSGAVESCQFHGASSARGSQLSEDGKLMEVDVCQKGDGFTLEVSHSAPPEEKRPVLQCTFIAKADVVPGKRYGFMIDSENGSIVEWNTNGESLTFDCRLWSGNSSQNKDEL